MSYKPRYNYDSDSDAALPPMLRSGYSPNSGTPGHPSSPRHAPVVESGQNSSGNRRQAPQAPPPPPSLQPGGRSRHNTPTAPSFPSHDVYRPSPPSSTNNYQSPPNAYRQSPPNTPPFAYNRPLPNTNQSASAGRSPGRDVYSQIAPLISGSSRGGASAGNGANRGPPPPSYHSSQVPSALNIRKRNNAPPPMKHLESYSEDYSAYGLSNSPARPQNGRPNAGGDSGSDRRKTEQMALTVGENIKRDERTMAAKIGDLVVSTNEKLTAAQSVIDKVIQNDTVKLAKEQAEAILSPAKDVIAFLNVMKNIHPAVGAVATIFTALIKLEVDRRENDKNIAVLHLAMTNLLFVLSYLEPSFDTADKIKSVLQEFLQNVCKTMNQFGNFCDVYYKQRSLVKMIRSSSYKGKLTGFATAFEDHKKELRHLMITKTAATVTKMDTNVKDVSAKLDQVLAFINMQSRKEVWVESKIQELGGEELVVADDKLLAKIGKIVKEKIDQQTLFALRENVDDVIRSNFARFNLKVETAMNEIKSAVQRSTETILTRLDSGPHDLIEDEDIKTVWKDMNWRLSCKSRHFVDAVHHHFAQKFAKYTLENGEPHPEWWTLKFLSNIIFYPAIGDAIDEDGSGYLSVHEVNRFFKARPKHWTTTQWMAYWAAGWYLNAVSYRHRCMAMIDSIEEATKNVMPQNRSALKPYLKKDCYGKIHLMLEGLYVDNLQYHGEEGPEYDSLAKFRKEVMDEELTNMKAHLAKPNYNLDSKEAVLAVLGSSRVEVSLLPLLFLVLRRHKKIIDIASTLVLEEMEFDAMVNCIENITEAFETRCRNLLESWRQQRLDTSLQIGCFAGGIFEAWHEEFYDADNETESEWESEYEEESEDEEYKEEERVAHAEDASESRKAADILLYGIPQPQPSTEETQTLKDEIAARKSKKEAKRAKREASEAPSDDDEEEPNNDGKVDQHDSSEDEYGPETPAGRTSGNEFKRPKSSTKTQADHDSGSDPDDDMEYDYEERWDSSDDESDSGNSSDSSASDFVTRKVRKPKLEERIATLENQLTEMQETLQQILALTKKKLSNR